MNEEALAKKWYMEVPALECREDTEEQRPQGVTTNEYGTLLGTTVET